MKAVRLLTTYLGMFAVVLGAILLVNRLSRPAERPWSDLVADLPAARATAAPGQDAQAAGLSLRVLETRLKAAKNVVDKVRLSSRAQAQPGQTFLLVTLLVTNDRAEAVSLHFFGTQPDSSFVLGITEPRQRTAEPVLPTDVSRLGGLPLQDATLAPGGSLQGTVGFVVNGSDVKGSSLLVVLAVAGEDAFPAFELALD